MKKICLTCEHWKRYIKKELGNSCLCIVHCRENIDIYTDEKYSCKYWKEWKHNFKKFRDSIKPKTKIG